MKSQNIISEKLIKSLCGPRNYNAIISIAMSMQVIFIALELVNTKAVLSIR